MTNYRLLDIKYLLFHKIWLKIKGAIHGNGIGVYYIKWSNNFGDLLNPIILKYYGFTPHYEYPINAKAISIGTIISLLPNNYSGYILGSGIDRNQNRLWKKARIIGVRGKFTKEVLQLPNETIIGDPGLLMPIIEPLKRKNIYIMGLIPHESEIEDCRIAKLIKNNPNIKLISPHRDNPIDVLRDINDCQYIVSSSLHGLIISDAYGIPNGRIKLNDLDNSNDFKFRDYYSSLDEELKSLQLNGYETLEQLIAITRLPNSAKIEILQKEINDMFIRFKSLYITK